MQPPKGRLLAWSGIILYAVTALANDHASAGSLEESLLPRETRALNAQDIVHHALETFTIRLPSTVSVGFQPSSPVASGITVTVTDEPTTTTVFPAYTVTITSTIRISGIRVTVTDKTTTTTVQTPQTLTVTAPVHSSALLDFEAGEPTEHAFSSLYHVRDRYVTEKLAMYPAVRNGTSTAVLVEGVWYPFHEVLLYFGPHRNGSRHAQGQESSAPRTKTQLGLASAGSTVYVSAGQSQVTFGNTIVPITAALPDDYRAMSSQSPAPFGRGNDTLHGNGSIQMPFELVPVAAIDPRSLLRACNQTKRDNTKLLFSLVSVSALTMLLASSLCVSLCCRRRRHRRDEQPRGKTSPLATPGQELDVITVTEDPANRGTVARRAEEGRGPVSQQFPASASTTSGTDRGGTGLVSALRGSKGAAQTGTTSSAGAANADGAAAAPKNSSGTATTTTSTPTTTEHAGTTEPVAQHDGATDGVQTGSERYSSASLRGRWTGPRVGSHEFR